MRELVKKLLAKWAHEVWLREKPVVIGITGTIAKTSTKEAIVQVLKIKFKDDVFWTPGNLNNEFGLPLAILGFEKSVNGWQYPLVLWKAFWRKNSHRKRAHYWVLEMGADKPGDIDYLVEIVRPDIAVVTTVGASHLQLLKTVDGVFREKSALVKAIAPTGTVFLNKNDELLTKMAELTKANVVYFAPEIDQIAQEAAKAIGKFFAIDEVEIAKTLESFESKKGRMNTFEGLNGATVIDDTYNANPLSMKVALYCLDKKAKQLGKKRKVAILGDMFDLGDYGPLAHRELEDLLTQYADHVVGVGELMQLAGADEWYPSSDTQEMQILNNIRSDDIILVKGSRGMKMEKIIEKLRK